MLETSARLLRLLGLLQTRREWSGNELAAKLGVSARTVRRDMEKLRSLGYPIDAVGGAGGGYRLAAGAAMPPLLLDDEEAVAVAVGLRTAVGAAITGIAETSVRTLAKLDQMLPTALRYKVNTLTEALVAMPMFSATVEAGVLTAIAAAIRDRHQLRFDYVSHNGHHSVRAVEPYRLVHAGRRWYLFAWETGKSDWRSFRVDRLALRTPTGPRYTPRELPAKDLATYLAMGMTNNAYRYQAVLTMYGSAAAVRDEVPPTLGVVEPIDENTCTLRIGSDSLDQLAVWVAAFGFEFSVREPPELLDHLRTLTGRLARAAWPERRQQGWA